MYIMKTFGFTKDDVAAILKDHLECNLDEEFDRDAQVTLRVDNDLPNGHEFTLVIGGCQHLDVDGSPVEAIPDSKT